MSNPAQIVSREDRAFRAVLFALAVMAQLLLPAIVLREQALAGDLCVTRSGDAGSQNGKAHAHDQQQCAHCRLHDCSSVAPPSSSVVVLPPHQAHSVSIVAVVLPPTLARRAQPPPTGPPLS